MSPPIPTGWHLRVWLDLDVIFGDEALAAVQLSLVPVLVIFHVEDLRQERSREVSAQPLSPWERGQAGSPPLPQTPCPPLKPGEKWAVTKVTWFGGTCTELGSRLVWLTMGSGGCPALLQTPGQGRG